MAMYSTILAWKTPWTEEPGGLQSIGLQRIRHNLVTEHTAQHINSEKYCALSFNYFFLFCFSVMDKLTWKNLINKFLVFISYSIMCQAAKFNCRLISTLSSSSYFLSDF